MAKNRNRNAKGQFIKGASGNPSGRPVRPPEMLKYAKEAPEKLKAIAEDEATPIKVRAEIERWFFESIYGKPTQAVDLEGKVDNVGTQVIRFEGELEEWSR